MSAVDHAWDQFRDRRLLTAGAGLDAFGDGAFVVERLVPDRTAVFEVLAARAKENAPLDPQAAVCVMRAALGLSRIAGVELVWTTFEEVVVVLSPSARERPGGAAAVHDRLVSCLASRLALLTGHEVPIVSAVYVFDSRDAMRAALVAVQSAGEEALPELCARRLGAQMSGRGEVFHPSMIETLEEQTEMLQSQQVDLERLPGWWWRGAAARPVSDGAKVELIDRLPEGDDFARFIG